MRCSFLGASLMVFLVLHHSEPCDAVDGFFHSRGRARSSNHLPKFDYAQQTWPFSSPSRFSVSTTAVAATDPTEKVSRIKPFHVRANQLEVGHVALDRIGLSINGETGELTASGRIVQKLQNDGRSGSHVTICIAAFMEHNDPIRPTNPIPGVSPQMSLRTPAAQTNRASVSLSSLIAKTNQVDGIPPDAVQVWSTRKRFWVSREHANVFSFTEAHVAGKTAPPLKHYFEHITHLWVEFEYQKDR